MGFSGNSQASDTHAAYSNPYFKVLEEKLGDWDVFQSFLEQNPDVKERYEVHKTYEILNDTRNR